MATLGDLKAQQQQFFKQKGEQQQGQIEGQTQGNVAALQRRFTSMGGANTGAAIAAEQEARNQGLAQQRQAATDLTGQQLQAGEGDIGRQFQAEQAQLAREGGAGESALARQFATQQTQLGFGEAEKARQAQLGESEKARQFQGGLAQQDLGFKREIAGNEQSNKLAEMELAKQQFQHDKDVTAFNERLARIDMGLPEFDINSAEGKALAESQKGQEIAAQQELQKRTGLTAETIKRMKDFDQWDYQNNRPEVNRG